MSLPTICGYAPPGRKRLGAVSGTKTLVHMDASTHKPGLMQSLRILYNLFKPGLAGAVLLTVVPGLLLGPTMPSWGTIILSLLGTLLVAMSSFCYNQILERRTDSLMKRTKGRALPSGMLESSTVALIGSSLLALGFLILYLYVNLTAALIAFASFVIYVFIYTVLLKPRTEHNTVVGGLSGSIGPLIGEATATGSLSLEGFLLFFLVFLWQPPHFWALSIFLKQDYAAAGLPMMPVVRGIRHTVGQMILYQVALSISMVLVFYPMAMAGMLFLIPSLVIALIGLFFMFRLRQNESMKLARTTFFISILHISVWHVMLTIDLYLRKFSI